MNCLIIDSIHASLPSTIYGFILYNKSHVNSIIEITSVTQTAASVVKSSGYGDSEIIETLYLSVVGKPDCYYYVVCGIGP